MESIKEFPREYGHGRANLNGPRVAGARSLPASDQAISQANSTRGLSDVRPGPGLRGQASSVKLQASSVKLSNQPVQASSGKHQAPGSKLQASSHKRQAP